MRSGSTLMAASLSFAILSGPQSASAQLASFPDHALPSSGGTPSTWLAASYARGLNDASGEVNGFAGVIGHAGTRVSVMGAGAYLEDDGDDEFTLGGAIGVDLLDDGSPTQLMLQGGIGWIDIEGLSGETLTVVRFPIGLALKRPVAAANGGTFTPWIMPRLNVRRSSRDSGSDTDTHFGASGGASFTSQGGLGVHVALDVLVREDDQPFTLGLGLHYLLGR